MPGTPFTIPPAMMASIRLEEHIKGLPHSGGDPELAAVRATRGDAHVRLMDPGERVRKPACTVEIGGRNFEIVDPRTGRKPNRSFDLALYCLRSDLPSSGWVGVPADMDALDEEKEAFEEFRGALSLRLLGDEDPLEALALTMTGPSPRWSVIDDAERFDDLLEKGRVGLRDEYAKKVSAL